MPDLPPFEGGVNVLGVPVLLGDFPPLPLAYGNVRPGLLAPADGLGVTLGPFPSTTRGVPEGVFFGVKLPAPVEVLPPPEFAFLPGKVITPGCAPDPERGPLPIGFRSPSRARFLPGKRKLRCPSVKDPLPLPVGRLPTASKVLRSLARA